MAQDCVTVNPIHVLCVYTKRLFEWSFECHMYGDISSSEKQKETLHKDE